MRVKHIKKFAPGVCTAPSIIQKIYTRKKEKNFSIFESRVVPNLGYE